MNAKERVTYTLLILVLLGANNALAQFSEIINSDRPGASISASSLGNRVLQWQVGGEYGQLRYPPITSLSNQFNNQNGGGFNFVMHYGLTDRFDLGGSLTYSHATTTETRLKRITTQLVYSVWTRANVLQRDGYIPAVAVRGEVLLPDAQTEFYNYRIGGRLTLMTDQKLGGRTLLSSNIGVNFGGIPFGFYTLQLKIIASDVTFIYVEHYGNFGTDYERYPTDDEVKSRLWYAGFDGGMGFVLHRNVQLDVYAGYATAALSQVSRYEWFAGLGLSWRIHFKKRKKSTETTSNQN